MRRPDTPPPVDWKARLKELGLARKRGAASGAGPTPPRAKPAGLGPWGEGRAALLLEGAGLSVLDRNWRAPGGELDLVALEGEDVVFVEVKTRRSRSHGLPAEAVGTRKRSRILAAARAWLASHPAAGSRGVRFDVVAIEGDPGEVRWIRGAFDAS